MGEAASDRIIPTSDRDVRRKIERDMVTCLSRADPGRVDVRAIRLISQGKRIRLQDLPKLTEPTEAQKVFTTWPAYRGSQGTVRTMQHRLFDCYWQMRHPQLDYASETATALMVYMAKFANGGEVNAPALKP